MKPSFQTKAVDFVDSLSHARGVTFITLEATAMGRALYERCGFVAMQDEMRLMEGV